MNAPAFSFTSQQFDALAQVKAWIESAPSNKKIFRLLGCAGTGKSTMASLIGAMVDDKVIYAAFTNAAATVMAHKGCTGARTLHNLLFRPRRGSGALHFVRKPIGDKLDEIRLIIVDECTLVSDEQAMALVALGKPILLLGDPDQLLPLSGPSAFSSGAPDVLLTEIHRQAKGSPVLHLATQVRLGRPLVPLQHGASRVVSRGELDETDWMADQIIAGTNSACKELNRRVRDMRGFTGPTPNVGERLVCLNNVERHGIRHGETFRVCDTPRVEKNDLILDLVREGDHGSTPFTCATPLRSFARRRPVDRSSRPRFDYAYAITCHQAAGSQWPSVLVLDDSRRFREHGHRWLYTAITRAQERVTIAL